MFEINGTNQRAISMVDNLDEETINQIRSIASCEAYANSKIRIMADAHAGKGSTIGTTIQLTEDKIIPNTLGVDIACGVDAVNLGILPKNFDFELFDNYLRKNVPAGNSIFQKCLEEISYLFSPIKNIIRNVARDIKKENMVEYYLNSIGTLGGGNHFISLEKNMETDEVWLIVHTGSRRFGYDIATFWQDRAISETNSKKYEAYTSELLEIEPSKRQEYKNTHANNTVEKGYEFLSGESTNEYLKHVQMAYSYASVNRIMIILTLMKGIVQLYNMEYDLTAMDRITSVHNYYDEKFRIIRKGAISAQLGENCIIPLNMRDGSLLCVGKGKEEWNYSAPHGAGRIGSRAQARKTISMEEYKASMEGIYSSCINKSTIDESPMAYKDINTIKEAIKDTVEIKCHLKPIYNYKHA